MGRRAAVTIIIIIIIIIIITIIGRRYLLTESLLAPDLLSVLFGELGPLRLGPFLGERGDPTAGGALQGLGTVVLPWRGGG
jgi:hypothetical protein